MTLPATMRGIATSALVAAVAAGVGFSTPRPQSAVVGTVHRQFLSGPADDWEPSLALSPNGGVHISATRRLGSPDDRRLTLQTVVWSSADRGRTFGDAVNASPQIESQGDARIRSDSRGILYATWLSNDRDAEGKNVAATSGLTLAVSRDRGKTFRAQTIGGEKSSVADKPELAVSPDGQNLFVAVEGVGGPLLFGSTDSGSTWSRRRIVETRSYHYWPTGLQLGKDGMLWLSVPSFSHWGLRARRSEMDATLHLMRSSDQGKSWMDDTIVVAKRVRRGCLHDPQCLKVPSIKAALDDRGRAYVLYTVGRPKHPYHLALVTSADGGKTWSRPLTLPRAPRPLSGDEADHDDPEIVAAGDGLVYIVWTDDRAGALNLYARRSTDAGRTWSPEVQLSSGDRSGFERYYGDYGGVAIDANGSLNVAWSEGKGSIGRPGAKGGTWFARWDPK